jgi:hypothetical protein
MCRDPLTRPARRCFVAAQCPVCLTECAAPYVLPCGHVLCGDDLKAVGGFVEQDLEDFKTRRLDHQFQSSVVICAIFLAFYGTGGEAGAPAQALYELTRYMSQMHIAQALLGSTTRLSEAACFWVRENSRHTCQVRHETRQPRAR